MSLPKTEPDNDAAPETSASALSIPELGTDAPVRIARDEVPTQVSELPVQAAPGASDSLNTGLQALSISNQDNAPPSDTNVAPAATHLPPTPSTETVTAPLSVAQHRFILSVLRKLKGHPQARPFLEPVDHVMLAIPNYPKIITRPMDLGTVGRKAQASTPGNPDLNSVVGYYSTVDAFVADVRLIVANCLKFNGPNSLLTEVAQWLEKRFDELMKELPPSEEVGVIAQCGVIGVSHVKGTAV